MRNKVLRFMRNGKKEDAFDRLIGSNMFREFITLVMHQKAWGLAIKIAKGNNSVDLTPEIHGYDRQARQLFYPEIPETNHSNPDMRINGILADLVTPDNWTDEKLKRLSKKFSDQHVGIAIIYLKNTDANPQEIMAKAAGYYTDGKHSTIKELWLVDKSGEIFKFIRTDL